MRIVVTGASGFIGGHLVRSLSPSRDVIGVARSVNSDAGMLQVTDYSQTPAGDVLVHLANKRDRTVSRDDDEAEAAATVRTLVRKGFAKVVYVSSAAVYGDDVHRTRIPEEPLTACDAYSRMKLACETLVLESNGVVARLANTYGDGMADANVVSTVLAQVPGTGPLRVQDDTPVRDFLWIEDAVAALEAMIDCAGSGIYNVGTGRGVSIGELAQVALLAAGQGDRPVVATGRGGRPSHLVLDIGRTVERTGWKPRTTIEEGIKQLLAAKSESRQSG